MSETTFPFADVAANEAYDDDAAGQRKTVLAIAVAVAVAAVAVGGFVFLRGGGDAELSVIPHAPRAAGVGAQKPAVKAVTTKKLPTAYKATLGRDPFKALYVVPVEQPAGTVAPVATTPVAPVAAAPASSGSNSSGSTSSTPTTTRYALKLVSVSKPSAGEVTYFTWLVEGKRTVVVPAQRFGKYGELVVLATEKNASGTTTTGAVIQVGDDTPIDVMIGEIVNVL
jgi:hypothetical protein